MNGPILVEGKSCWRRLRADRLAFLIDGASYFSALADAIERATRSIFVVGWDLDTRVRLRRDGQTPSELGDILLRAVRAKRGLRVRLLPWDFAMLYALERQPLPLLGFMWLNHRRLLLRHDSAHPPTSSHHQKIVVIDDRIAFAGGIDLTTNRWDTPDHQSDDERRRNTTGWAYAPFHDVQVAVDGQVAESLAELVRSRWNRATGQRVVAAPGAVDPWPPSLTPDIRSCVVGIARTMPEYNDQPEIREVEQLYLDAIAQAKSYIYIENQYLTAPSIGDALSRRLAEKNGPEVFIVLPAAASGWLEQSTMDVLRTRLLRRIRKADEFGRLTILCPVVPDPTGEHVPVYVHGKVMIIDDIWARVGSANLSNRSMGLDSECDLFVDASERKEHRDAVRAFRNRLLADHLGADPEQVDQAIREHGRIARAVEEFQDAAPTLIDGVGDAPAWLLETIPESDVVDPERPVDVDRWLRQVLPNAIRQEAEVNLTLIAVLSVVAAGFVFVWSRTPLGSWASDLTPPPVLFGALLVSLAYAIGGLLMIPATLLTVLTVLSYGLWPGGALALFGLIVDATVGYFAGRHLPRDTVRRLAGQCLNRVSERLATRGLRAVLAVRLVPIGSFSAVSFVAGAGRVRLGDYWLGTLGGTIPHWIISVVLVDRLDAALRVPSSFNMVVSATLWLCFAAGTLLAARRLNRHKQSPSLDGSNVTPSI